MNRDRVRTGRTAPSLRTPRKTTHAGKCDSGRIRFPSWDAGTAAALRVSRNVGAVLVRYCGRCDGFHVLQARKEKA